MAAPCKTVATLYDAVQQRDPRCQHESDGNAEDGTLYSLLFHMSVLIQN